MFLFGVNLIFTFERLQQQLFVLRHEPRDLLDQVPVLLLEVLLQLQQHLAAVVQLRRRDIQLLVVALRAREVEIKQELDEEGEDAAAAVRL